MTAVYSAAAALMDKAAAGTLKETLRELTKEEPEETPAKPVDPRQAAAVKRKMQEMMTKAGIHGGQQ